MLDVRCSMLDVHQFLFRSDWTLAASGPRSCETTFQKIALIPSWATLDFVGWVEPTPDFVGFRCTQPNLHIAGAISKYETQHRTILKPSPRSLFLDQTERTRPGSYDAGSSCYYSPARIGRMSSIPSSFSTCRMRLF
jgi:hypothetical protein